MALHLCKDFLAKHPTSSTVTTRFYHVCLVAYFLRGVLGFTFVGHTSFNLEGASITKGSGVNNANINLGSPLERAVQLPGSYVVSAADLDRVLAIKSNLNPLMNSGLFRISGIDLPTNSVILTGRSWLDPPIPETGVSWRMFENEGTVTNSFALGTNGNPDTGSTTKYRGDLSATTSRIILQSPHSTNWQVRLCCETPSDSDGGSGQGHIGAAASFAPGYGGNSSGDFPNGGQHLHHGEFWNIGSDNSQTTRNTGVQGGLGSRNATIPGRYYMWGDDVTGTCFVAVRQHGSTETEGVVCFGLPEDEEQPIPTSPIYRLFCFGCTNNNADVTLDIKPEAYNNGRSQMGTAYGLGNQPITCVPVSWHYSTGGGLNTGIMNNGTAADDVYLGATTLWAWDLVAGTWDNTYINGGPQFQPLEPRRLGRLPFARRGRENFNVWSTSVDQGRTYLHVQAGMFLPWSGSIIP